MNGCQAGSPLGVWSLLCGSGAFKMDSILVTSLFSPLARAKLLKHSSFIGKLKEGQKILCEIRNTERFFCPLAAFNLIGVKQQLSSMQFKQEQSISQVKASIRSSLLPLLSRLKSCSHGQDILPHLCRSKFLKEWEGFIRSCF